MKLAPIPSLFPALLTTAGILHAAPLVYESFDYEPGSVSGGSGGTGFTGNWSTNNEAPAVVSPGLSWGSLSEAGNSVTDTFGGSGARDIGATSVLDNAGLMANGGTLWFSFTLNVAGTNRSNVDFNFALGSDGFHTFVTGSGGTFGERMNLETGEGIGFALTNRSSTLMDVEGAYWRNIDADDNAERVVQNTDATDVINRWGGDELLIVGRIDWGADDLANETLTIYVPDTSLALGTGKVWSTIAAFDQSAFDTVAFELKGGAIIDEIRFGATSDDVLPVVVSVVDPRITSFTSVGPDLWELTLEGQGETAYEFRSSTDLVFDPGTLVENLSQGDETNDPGTVGGTGNSLLTTNSDGNGTVRMMLTGPRNFILAQLPPPPPPLLDEGFEAGDGGFTVSTPEGTTFWAHGNPDSTDQGGLPNPGGSVTEGNGGSANCWGTDIGSPGYYANPTHTCLRSPVIDLTAVTAAELSFAMALDLDGGDKVTVNIIDDTTDTPFATDIVKISDASSSSAAWERVGPVSLPAAAIGERVRIEWCLTGTGGTSSDFMGWYIDDVLVEDTSP
jgi:hypothetical protein